MDITWLSLDAEAYIENYFAELQDKLGKGDLRLYLSDKDNWRRDILPTIRLIVLVHESLCYCLLSVNGCRQDTLHVLCRCLEADDLLGIKATKEKDCVIVSEDKDLKTIPAQSLIPVKDDRAPHNHRTRS